MLESDYRVEERTVPVEGGEILVRCIFPTAAGGPFPLLVWYHGGGNVQRCFMLSGCRSVYDVVRLLPWLPRYGRLHSEAHLRSAQSSSR